MADYDSSLAIQSISNSNSVKVSADTAANAVGNPIFTSITDGTDTLLIDSSGNLQAILAANSGVDIGDVDVTSIIPGVGATNLGKAVDSAAGATDTGVATLAIRDDALTTLTPVDGDYVPLRVDSTGALWITGSITVSQEGDYVDDSAFTVGTDRGVAIGGVFTTDSVDAGDFGAFKMSAKRELFIAQDTAADLNVTEASASAILADTTAILADTTAILSDTTGILADTSSIDGKISTGGGVEAGAILVTMASDSTGVLSIDDNGSSITVDGSVTVSATDLDIRALSHTTDSVSIGDGTDTWSIDGSGYGQVDIAAQSLTALKISATSAANTALNPIFVDVVDSNVTGGVHDYDVGTVASAATDNHDYTVTGGKTLLLHQVVCSGSAAGKFEVQSGPVASLATVAVGFISSANLNTTITFNPPLVVPDTSTGTLRVIRKNRDNQSQDLYSTIMGNEV